MGTGSLQAAGVDFVLGPTAVSTHPTVRYNHNVFYYDADGTGAGAAVALTNVGGPFRELPGCGDADPGRWHGGGKCGLQR